MKPRLIGIAGPSCSGKTELARALASRLGAPILGLDSYYRDLPHLPPARRARLNFDEPAALDGALLIEHVRRLKEGLPAEKPVYDFATHTRTAVIETVEPRAYIVVEGLFALYWEELRRLYTLSVFVKLDDAACYRRRLERDVRERGRTPESVLEQYTATVRPMAQRYVLPAETVADVVVGGDEPLEKSVVQVLERLPSPAAGNR